MPRERAYNIFASLSADFASLYPSKTGWIACPLCLREFQSPAIESGDLTEEHPIPRHLGGTHVTLTCKTCNNTHGTALDSHLVQMVRMEDALEGEGLIRGRVDIAGTRLPAEIGWRSGEKNDPRVIRITGGGKQLIETAKQTLTDGVKQINLTLNFRYILNRYQLALARIAYLSLFNQFGYRYILSGAAEVIRTMLNNPNVSPTCLPVMQIGKMRGSPVSPVTIIPIKGIDSATGYLVLIRVATMRTRYFWVLMPSEFQNPETVLSEIETLARSLSGRTVTIGVAYRDQRI